MAPSISAGDPHDGAWMDLALRLAKRGYGWTSPNPMVGSVIVRRGQILGRGWHRRAGQPHAEIEALRDAQIRGHTLKGATLFVTLEPCSTTGRTPPCTDAILDSGLARVVVGATDPNPNHAGRAYEILRRGGIQVTCGVRAAEAARLNEPFNHWIVQHTPFVTVKAAMSLDGKIATVSGESRWITSDKARAFGMKLRQGADAILVGINTVLADDPMLTVRQGEQVMDKPLRRLVLDSRARTPLHSRLLSDGLADRTTIVVSDRAPGKRLERLAERAHVLVAPASEGRIGLSWLLAHLGRESVTSLLVEGGASVNASFLLGGFAHRVAFFYAPVVIGGRSAPGAVGGAGVAELSRAVSLGEVSVRRVGMDLLLTGRVLNAQPTRL